MKSSITDSINLMTTPPTTNRTQAPQLREREIYSQRVALALPSTTQNTKWKDLKFEALPPFQFIPKDSPTNPQILSTNTFVGRRRRWRWWWRLISFHRSRHGCHLFIYDPHTKRRGLTHSLTHSKLPILFVIVVCCYATLLIKILLNNWYESVLIKAHDTIRRRRRLRPQKKKKKKPTSDDPFSQSKRTLFFFNAMNYFVVHQNECFHSHPVLTCHERRRTQGVPALLCAYYLLLCPCSVLSLKGQVKTYHTDDDVGYYKGPAAAINITTGLKLSSSSFIRRTHRHHD